MQILVTRMKMISRARKAVSAVVRDVKLFPYTTIKYIDLSVIFNFSFYHIPVVVDILHLNKTNSFDADALFQP
jgi:hypothetical protein